jgi:hypothetical protein
MTHTRFNLGGKLQTDCQTSVLKIITFAMDANPWSERRNSKGASIVDQRDVCSHFSPSLSEPIPGIVTISDQRYHSAKDILAANRYIDLNIVICSLTFFNFALGWSFDYASLQGFPMIQM